MGGGLGPGCRPAPAEAPAAGRQDQHQKRAIRGMAGWVRLRGTLQVRPCKLGRRIHAAHAPATGPTPPSTGSCCCWWVSTLVDTADRHAWMDFWFICASRGGPMKVHAMRPRNAQDIATPWHGPGSASSSVASLPSTKFRCSRRRTSSMRSIASASSR
ncbi:hypothetical protein D7Y16_10230 [Stenotrophomonas maltophilia]|nr:hypothetical protein [Stenotrophomonas maltophilia]MBA0246307.1 hypothetical protein [Stenotrophomonas maltophilia]MBA0307213.1 hypothetical protein [Stenotrophomonas maltophilia]MBA0439416.1 hypothetical protein [Stenotrophomonas maltophilia]MBA0532970.1 hypothetical protein [Stenotrophomonas maltophilia]